MKKFIILAAMLLAFASLSYAGCGNCAPKNADGTKAVTASMKTSGEHVTLEGTLVCLACSLKPEGANADCKTFGHTHSLKTDDGKFISFLENKFSSDLINGEKYHNKKVEIHGVYYTNANTLDVESFTVDGKQKTWCANDMAMDGCGAH